MQYREKITATIGIVAPTAHDVDMSARLSVHLK